jgi:rhodanese-related sulfurtransferase
MTPKTAYSPAAGRFGFETRDGMAGMPGHRTAKTADELLMEARALLPRRPSPAETRAAQATGALLIDIRGDDQRRADGLIPGAVLLPRNALEWRCDPASRWRHPALAGRDQHLILICQEGFQSSLAAATLQRLGLVKCHRSSRWLRRLDRCRATGDASRKQVTGARAVQAHAGSPRLIV